MAWFVIIGTIPIVVVGLLFKDLIEGQLTKSLTVIGSSLIGVALLLWWADRRASFSKTSSQITTADAIWIGCSQILALIPGSSRSGTTIMAGLFRGLTREHAARFSFLLSIPAILGSGILQFIGELEHITWTDGGLNLVIATVASAVSGYWSIAFLLRYLRSRSLSAFIIYRIALGLVILLVGCSPERDRGDRAGIDRIDTLQVDSMQGASETPSVTDLEDSIVITQQVLVQTSLGRIRIGLYGKDAPLTVQNFLDLVKRRYYDGVLFHRVAKGFVIQTGDPTTRDASARRSWGRGGETANGKPLPEELNPSLMSARVGYRRGVVAMARKPAPSTATSQFFICLDSTMNLPYQYTIFGRVLDGMEVVDSIGKVNVEPGLLGENDGIPIQPITVHWIRKRQ
jgi:cyclophilin family peptidyl-prolyl cis-trans isomerase